MGKSKADRETFDDYYAGFWGGTAFRWLDMKKLRIIRRVLAELGENLRVVDIGCGSAGISSQLVGALPGIEVIGVDHDASLLEVAESRGVRTKQVDFDRPLPFDEGHFDAILMIDTIEHVESRQKTIQEVKRILSPEGALIVFTPPYDTLTWLAGEKFHHLVTQRRSDHISPFTQESLNWLLDVNFVHREVGYANFGLTMYGVGRNKRV